jgi:putative protease
LQVALKAPLTEARLREHLGRFGESRFVLGEFRNELEGEVILPIGELNRLRRELVYRLESRGGAAREEVAATWRQVFEAAAGGGTAGTDRTDGTDGTDEAALSVLCRSQEQIDGASEAGATTLYLDFEDIRRYSDAVAGIRARGGAEVFLATPRIQKAGEEGFFKLIENAEPDGVLIRNLGAIAFFQNSAMRKIGDFSLNVSNPLTAQLFMQHGFERMTISYDLDVNQVLDLLGAAPPAWFELTIHQHMPMFHMEHCVFAAFMSKGSSFLDCGRPCESHRVHLRDRVGMEHPLRADVGCRNTLFNAVPQTGARFFDALAGAGLRAYRVELLEQNGAEAKELVAAYRRLLSREAAGEELWRSLRAQSQLGVTRGTL